MHRIVTKLLRHRDEPNAVPGELADVEFQLEMVAKKAAERVDDHDIEGRGFLGARLDHPLEFRAAVVGRRCTGLDECLDQFQPACPAVGLALLALVGDRYVMFGLAHRRDAQVEGGALDDGHDARRLMSSARSEQFVEKIAKPRLEHIDLGLGKRNTLRPVVR